MTPSIAVENLDALESTLVDHSFADIDGLGT